MNPKTKKERTYETQTVMLASQRLANAFTFLVVDLKKRFKR